MRKKIGDFLVDRGVLTRDEVERTLAYSAEQGLRFGEAAVKLGLLTSGRLVQALGTSSQVEFFNLEGAELPLTALKIFNPKEITRRGALPLGYVEVSSHGTPARLLKTGFLDPRQEENLHWVDHEARTRMGERNLDGVVPYLIFPDQLLNLLQDAFNISEREILTLSKEEVNPVLLSFLSAGTGRS